MSSISEFSSVQHLHRIFASSPTFTERVIMHNVINDMTNNVVGMPKQNTNSRHVLSKSKRARTFAASLCNCYKNSTSVLMTFIWIQSISIYIILNLYKCRCCCCWWWWWLDDARKMLITFRSSRALSQEMCVWGSTYSIVKAWITWLCRIIQTISTMWMQKIHALVFQCIHASIQIDKQLAGIIYS